jgi:hypothetical protein
MEEAAINRRSKGLKIRFQGKEVNGIRGSVQSAPTDASSSETSARVGFCPHALIKSPRLVLATRPFPLVSNNANASRYCSVGDGFRLQLAWLSLIVQVKRKRRHGLIGGGRGRGDLP